MSTRAPVKTPATYQDLCRVPDHLVAEILEGELYTTPRPATPHALTASMLAAEVIPVFGQNRGGPGGWWILIEPELHLGADVLVPDFAGWRRDRLAAVPDAAFMTVAPQWACEILSPSTERIDRRHKLRIYAREGVDHLWLVNPRLRTLEVLRLEGQFWLLTGTYGGDEAVHAEPFEAVALPLARIWPELSTAETETVER